METGPDFLGQVDLAFVIDATGSMAPYIEEARRQARAKAEEIAAKGDLDLLCGVVFYRDHPPEDRSFVTRVNPLGPLASLPASLAMGAEGGGDLAEAVWDGVHAAATRLAWRPNADKLLFLIGDAPPHGVGVEAHYDHFPEGCPCGLDGGGLAELLVSKAITLHAISIAGFRKTTDVFTALAEATGGACTEVKTAAASTHVYAETISYTSEAIADARTYSTTFVAAGPGPLTLEDMAGKLGWTIERTNSTAAYLAHRGVPIGPSPAWDGPGESAGDALDAAVAFDRERRAKTPKRPTRARKPKAPDA